MTEAPVGPVSQEEWEAHRAESLAAGLPADLTEGKSLPDVLLPYQARAVATVDANDVTVIEKSRRIGLTWGLAASSVLTAGGRKSAGGMDVMYLGYNLDMAREFIDACAMWARAFAPAATSVDEFLFPDPGAPDKFIQAFRIRFASGFEIVALTSRPRSLRGRQGLLIADEAAFHDELAELLKAAMAFLIWGGKVVVVSTHDGADNAFNELVEETHAEKKPFALVRITFDDAVADGLYRRICLVTGKTWSPAAEAEWVAKIRAQYGEDAGEELDVIPKAGGGAWLSRALIVARMRADIPVLRWTAPEGFVHWSDDRRFAWVDQWLADEVEPVLQRLTGAERQAVGVDFGRVIDLTVLWAASIQANLALRTDFVIELRDCPHTEQAQIALHVLRRLPRFSGAAFDAGGSGSYLAERCQQQMGASMVEALKFTEEWYRTEMPPLRAAFQDDEIVIPKDDEILTDLRSVRLVRGVPRVPEAKTQGSTGKRHGDAAIALALCRYASERGMVPIGGWPSGVKRAGYQAERAAGGEPGGINRDNPWGSVGGGMARGTGFGSGW
ncbi:MAG: hypothetical protein RIB84_22515 [Sneathiellaceae bacterium]